VKAVKWELRFFGLAFGIPFVVTVSAFLATTPSPLPIWRRLVTLEDACPYGVCFIIPLIMALITRGIVALLGDG